LNLQHVDHYDRIEAVTGEALWQDKTTAAVTSTTLTAPFIVPAVIEHLKHSKWASTVSVVPGEAEAFCAHTARVSDAAILTNDSDPVLFAVPSENYAVVLLRSLSMNTTGGVRTVEAQCWRPRQIAQKLDLTNLLNLGFERSKDLTASFAVIRQRSLHSTRAHKDESAFKAFAAQFECPSLSLLELSISSCLTILDPRLAELVCQLDDLSDPTMQSNLYSGLHVTLPILHEDPTRDSSWSYGRPLRHAAYCLLFLHKVGSKKGFLGNEGIASDHSIVELSRKGQGIGQDLHLLTSSNQPLSVAKEQLHRLSQYVLQAFPSDSPQTKASSYILWALHIVLNYRLANSKQSISRKLVEYCLGLAHPPAKRFQKLVTGLQTNDEADSWTLLHLNANIQAVLYSARMLKQTTEYLQKDNRNHPKIVDDPISKMATVLELMPPIQDLFLDPNRMRQLMQQVPQEKMKEMVRPIFEDAGWPVDGTTDVNNKESLKGETVINRKSKKRRKKGKSEGHGKHSVQASMFRSTNPFDLLTG